MCSQTPSCRAAVDLRPLKFKPWLPERTLQHAGTHVTHYSEASAVLYLEGDASAVEVLQRRVSKSGEARSMVWKLVVEIVTVVSWKMVFPQPWRLLHAASGLACEWHLKKEQPSSKENPRERERMSVKIFLAFLDSLPRCSSTDPPHKHGWRPDFSE